MGKRKNPTPPIACAMLLARLFESQPLACAHCGADMRIVALITEAAPVEYAT